MRFYVLGDDGQKYGPADVQTLENWAREGRLLANSRLQNEMSGEVATAGQLLPNSFVSAAPPPRAAPAAPTYDPKAQPKKVGSDGNMGTALLGIGLAIVSVVLLRTIVFGAFIAWSAGMRMSFASKDDKPALAWTGIVLNGIAALLWIAYLVLRNTQPGTR